MEYTVNVPYVAQKEIPTCWNAAYRMMLMYKGKDPSAADQLPNDKQMRDRGILDSEFLACRNKLGMTSSTYKAFATADQIEEKLKFYGAIWVSGTYCEGHKHILILRGIKRPLIGSDEVLVNDPWSGFKYGLTKPRWIDLNTFVQKMNPVVGACQHWL
ncbi:MAG: hypothetical protein HY820_44260 [Acidobacteria bacterium]|nr:hypothetical protein [Acidobacteriota bacterium]